MESYSYEEKSIKKMWKFWSIYRQFLVHLLTLSLLKWSEIIRKKLYLLNWAPNFMKDHAVVPVIR